MSMLHNISDATAAPFAIRRLLRAFGRSFFRAVNGAIAAIIAQRERQARLAMLRRLSGCDD